MKSKKLIIFDLDGTLLNTVEDLGNGVNKALEKHGFPGHTMDEYRRIVGGGVRNLVTRALPDGAKDDDTVDKVLADFIVFYQSAISMCTCPYPGIPELLMHLQREGYMMAVASNKFQSGTETLIRTFFPDISFVCVLGSRPQAPLKPSPLIVEECLEAARKSSDSDVSAVMVGDSGVDISTASAAGIPIVAVSWGFRKKEELCAAGTIADNSDELYRVLTSDM